MLAVEPRLNQLIYGKFIFKREFCPIRLLKLFLQLLEAFRITKVFGLEGGMSKGKILAWWFLHAAMHCLPLKILIESRDANFLNFNGSKSFIAITSKISGAE